MNYGKITTISKSLSGVMFSAGAFLVAVWNVAGNPFFDPFHKVFMWSIPGLVLGFTGVWNVIQFVNAKNIRKQSSAKTEHETSVFQVLHMIKQSDENLAQVISTFLIVCVGIGLNLYMFREGSWKINNSMTFLALGWVTPFFFWKFFSSTGELKSVSKGKKTSSKPVAPTKGGAMVVEFNINVITFTLTDIIIGKSEHPLPSLKVNLSEIRDFRVFNTREEFQAFKSRNINGDLEFEIKATIAEVTFYTNPATRPDCLSITGSSGDINIYVSGAGFRWLLAIQPQYHELVTTLERKVGPTKKVAS